MDMQRLEKTLDDMKDSFMQKANQDMTGRKTMDITIGVIVMIGDTVICIDAKDGYCKTVESGLKKAKKTINTHMNERIKFHQGE